MTKTARQIIQQEVHNWTTKEDLVVLGRAQRLPMIEDAAKIWEYGKWCDKGGIERTLGIKPQIKFRGSRPESTLWDAIRDLSDDEGMEIHSATLCLSDDAIEIINLLYVEWLGVDEAIKQKPMRRQTFLDIRWAALETIANKIA